MHSGVNGCCPLRLPAAAAVHGRRIPPLLPPRGAWPGCIAAPALHRKPGRGGGGALSICRRASHHVRLFPLTRSSVINLVVSARTCYCDPLILSCCSIFFFFVFSFLPFFFLGHWVLNSVNMRTDCCVRIIVCVCARARIIHIAGFLN